MRYSILLALIPSLLQAQLASTAIPNQLLRFEIGGSFSPVDQVWLNGKKVGVGSLLSGRLDASRTPFAAEVENNLSLLLGQSAPAQNLGSILSTAQWQHNTALVTAAWGATPRMTLFVNLPLISTRTELQTTFDPGDATLGLNPAGPLGTAPGSTQTGDFLGALDAALESLNSRIQDGSYTGATLTRATAALSQGAALQHNLSATVGSGAMLLPVAGSAGATALLETIDQYFLELRDGLLEVVPSGRPALPAEALNENSFNALLRAPAGAGIRTGSGQPITTLGRIEVGAWRELISQQSGTSSFRGWGRALIRLGTGTEPDPYQLLDQGSGGKSHEIELGGTLDWQQPRRGVRLEGGITLPLSATVTLSAKRSEEILLPSSRILTLSHRPGPGVSIVARPWVALTHGFAITSMAGFEQRGEDHFTLLTQQPAGLDQGSLGAGTGGSGLRAGIGLSYYHNGQHHDGTVGLPQEAGFTLERGISGSGGMVLDRMTTRLYFRFYMR